MKLPQIQRILREDLREAPSWIDKLLNPLNQFLDTMYGGLNKNITLTENIDCQERVFTFTTKIDYVANNTFDEIQFRRTTKNKAKGVILADIRIQDAYYRPILNATSIQWVEIEGTIIVKYIAGLDDSTSYRIYLLII